MIRASRSRLTEAEYSELLHRNKSLRAVGPPVPVPRGIAKGRVQRHVPGVMNNLETEYAAMLDVRKHAGEIVDWWFEAVTFKLAPDLRYTPDFMVLESDMTISFMETKMEWGNGQVSRDDARVKFKVAAQIFPFRFVFCVKRAKKNGGAWDETE